jgi:hypothetical protein
MNVKNRAPAPTMTFVDEATDREFNLKFSKDSAKLCVMMKALMRIRLI